jgi:hypothetical protein
MNRSYKNIHWFFLTASIGCFAMAGYLSMATHIEPVTQPKEPAPRVEPHPASWGSSEGFAVAGGLCVLAAGLVVRNREPALLRAEIERDEDRADTSNRSLVGQSRPISR